MTFLKCDIKDVKAYQTTLGQMAIAGHRLGREIDSDDPEHALPYLRERPLVEG